MRAELAGLALWFAANIDEILIAATWVVHVSRVVFIVPIAVTDRLSFFIVTIPVVLVAIHILVLFDTSLEAVVVIILMVVVLVAVVIVWDFHFDLVLLVCIGHSIRGVFIRFWRLLQIRVLVFVEVSVVRSWRLVIRSWVSGRISRRFVVICVWFIPWIFVTNIVRTLPIVAWIGSFTIGSTRIPTFEILNLKGNLFGYSKVRLSFKEWC